MLRRLIAGALLLAAGSTLLAGCSGGNQPVLPPENAKPITGKPAGGSGPPPIQSLPPAKK